MARWIGAPVEFDSIAYIVCQFAFNVKTVLTYELVQVGHQLVLCIQEL